VRQSILRRPIDGTSPPSTVLADGKPHYFTIGPDGRTLVYSVSPSGGQSGAVMMRAFVGDTPSHQIFGMRGDEWAFRVSPHGEWLAYASSESGTSEVYVRPLAGPGPRVQLSSGGGIEPVWSRDGRRIFYRSLDARTLYAANISSSPTLSVASRTKLFEGIFDSDIDVADYDVSLDGNSFLMVRYPNFHRELVVTVNWADILRQRLRATQ